MYHDARAVHDAASLDIRDYIGASRASWIVAVVVPGASSGSSTVPGAYIKAETGEFVRPPNARLVAVKEGTWKAQAAANGVSIREGSYSWHEPLVEKRKLGPEDHFSPFVHGGTILFRPEAGGSGIEQFAARRLLFSDLANQVGAALTFAAEHPDLAQPTLLTGDNQVLAALAFRELVAADRLTSAQELEHLRRAESHPSAIFTYLLLARGREQVVANAVRSARDAGKLTSLALGAFAVWLLSGTGENRGRAESAVSLIASRLNELKKERDDYLRILLSTMAIQR